MSTDLQTPIPTLDADVRARRIARFKAKMAQTEEVSSPQPIPTLDADVRARRIARFKAKMAQTEEVSSPQPVGSQPDTAPNPPQNQSFHFPSLQQASQGLQQVAQGVGNAVNQAGSALNSVGKGVAYYSTHPLETFGAVVGTLPRAINGAILGAGEESRALNKMGPLHQMMEMGLPQQLVGSVANAITHPGAQTALDRNAKREIGLKPMNVFAPLRNNYDHRPLAQLERSYDPFDVPAGAISMQMGEGILNWIGGLSTETGTDELLEQIEMLPGEFVNELDALYLMTKMGKGAGGAVIRQLQKQVGKAKVDSWLTAMNKFHGINQDLEPRQAAVARGAASQYRNQVKKSRKEVNDLVDKHVDTLNSLNQIHGKGSRAGRRRALLANPETAEIVHELDNVAWEEGTDQVRMKMLEHYYKPPAHLANLPPGNTLHFWDEHYFPTQRVIKQGEQEAEPFFGQVKTNSKNSPAYNKRGGDGKETDNVAEQVRQRLLAGKKNAAKARYHREVLNAARTGTKASVAANLDNMVTADLNSKYGNIFQPRNEAEFAAVLKDLRAGNIPFKAFGPDMPIIKDKDLINRDIPLPEPKEYGLRPRLNLKKLKREKDKAAKRLIKAQEEHLKMKTKASHDALKQQKRVSQAANKAFSDSTRILKRAARSDYNKLSQADIRLAKGITGLEGGGEEIESTVPREASMGPGVLPGAPKSQGRETIEAKFRKENAKSKAMTPEHRQALKDANKAVKSAAKDMKARKAEIRAANPVKKGSPLSEHVKAMLSDAEAPLIAARENYRNTVSRIKDEVAQRKATPELDTELNAARGKVASEKADLGSTLNWLYEKHRMENAALRAESTAKKLSKEEIAQRKAVLSAQQKKEVDGARHYWHQASQQRDKVAAQIAKHRESLTPEQIVELKENAARRIKRLKAFNESGEPDTFITPSWGKETQRIMSKKGEKVRSAIDPLFKAALKREKDAGEVFKHYSSNIHNAAISKTVDRFLRAKESEVRFLARSLVRAEGRLASARSTNATIKRISDLIQDELKKSGELNIPKSVADLLYKSEVPPGPLGAHSPLESIANVFRDSTFAIPYVHGWNLITLTLKHGLGLDTVAKGLSYASRLEEQAFQKPLEELESLGQKAEYAGHDKAAYSKIPKIGPLLQRLSEKGQAVLNNIDHGLKLAAMEKFKKDGLSGPTLGAKIEDVYGNASPSFLSQYLRKFGGLFPGWRVQTLPQTTWNAVQTKGGRRAISQMNWLQNNLTQESEYGPNQQTPTEYNLFPALTEVEELALGPVGAAKYVASQGVLGLMTLGAGMLGDPATNVLSTLFSQGLPYTPLVKTIYDLAQQNPTLTFQDVLGMVGPRVTPEKMGHPSRHGPQRGTFQEKLEYSPQSYPGVQAIP